MAITLGLNIASLRARRQLDRSSDRISTVYERLATGQRINSAADDPAGLAVALSLDVEARIANQARRNVNDGISLLQTADSALEAIRGIVERKAELASQAASGSLSNEQRSLLNEEFQQLDAEIDRIASTTEFNGISLLEGGLTSNAARSFAFDNFTDFRAFDISADGRYITYRSNTNGSLEQLDLETNATTTIVQGGLLGSLSASATGERVVFYSDQDLTGENASGFAQVFVWDRNSGEYTQVTDTQGVESASLIELFPLTISADGSTIGFTSITRYDESGNATNYGTTGTIFLVDLESNSFTDMEVDSIGNSIYLNLSEDGSFASFSSSTDPLGTNPDLNPELFVFDNREGEKTLRQVTNSPSSFGTIGLQTTNDGKVYFSSVLDLVGQNSGGNNQLFEYNILTDSFEQLTQTTSGAYLIDRLRQMKESFTSDLMATLLERTLAAPTSSLS